jgi:hypothetical protein
MITETKKNVNDISNFSINCKQIAQKYRTFPTIFYLHSPKVQLTGNLAVAIMCKGFLASQFWA